MRTNLLFILLLSFSLSVINAQNNDKVEVRLVKNKFFLFNLKTGDKICKLASNREIKTPEGKSFDKLNDWVLGVKETKKNQDIISVYNSNGILPLQFSQVVEIGTYEVDKEFLLYAYRKDIPYITGVPLPNTKKYNFGLYTIDGQLVIQSNFLKIEFYHQDKDKQYYFTVKHDTGDGLYKEGVEIIPAKYYYIEPIALNAFVVVHKSLDEKGVFNLDGDLLIHFFNGGIKVNEDSTFTINENRKYGLLDKNGDVLIPQEYTEIEKIENQKYLVKIDDKQGVFDIASQKIVRYLSVEEKEELNDEDSDRFYSVVEQMPKFPGGESAMYAFIAKTVEYPPHYSESYIEGKVYIGFIINERGKVGDVKVLKGTGTLLDQAALDVVNAFPDFTPGYEKGKPVKVRHVIPINFKIY